MMHFVVNPYVAGLIVLTALYAICGIMVTWNPWRLTEGFDGRTSTSKAQFFFWTVAVLYGYTAFYTAWMRHLAADSAPVTAMPELSGNLLAAMGLSTVTVVAAKGITVGYVASGRLIKTRVAAQQAKSGLVQDDDGFPELVKIQMMAWTVIAIAVFLVNLAYQISSNDFRHFPGIDPTLTVLMGLGQGAYLGKKAASLTTAQPAPQPPAPLQT